ncbi:MAG: GspH/FimT family pseudopilin [Candidatus Sedimenticola sp. (ex Thyasira tokunagai)]
MGIFPQQKLCRLYGITLIELLIVLAISGILFASAGPAFSTLIGSTAITTAVNDMVGRLHLARSEAVTRRVKVTLCPSDDKITCLKTTEWHHGFIIFSNENGNGVVDGEDQLLRTYQPSSSRVEIYSTPGRKKLSYKPDGGARGSNATLAICDAGGELPPRYVIVSGTGRPRSSETKPHGSPISCG